LLGSVGLGKVAINEVKKLCNTFPTVRINTGNLNSDFKANFTPKTKKDHFPKNKN
jgi:hypothetical protein